MCTNHNFSKPFKSYLGENAVSNLINSMVEEHKNYSDMMRKYFNKELVWLKRMMTILTTLLNAAFVMYLMLITIFK